MHGVTAMPEREIPTLYEWIGGMPALQRLTTRFYEHVRDDAVLAPIFAAMDARHPQFVAQFIAEVFGGPNDYSRERGGHPHMVSEHLGRHLTEHQRQTWMALFLDTADEIGLPSDPEFRSAFVAYLEWGTRLAVINSQPGAAADPAAAMPKWGWGVPGGPFQG
jgi:hemoglobin